MGRRANVYLDRDTDDELRRRVDAVRATGRASSVSAEIRRALEEAAGNLRRARHDARSHLSAISLAVELLRRSGVRHPDVGEAVRIIAAALDAVGEILAAPAARAPRPPAET